MCPSRLHRPPGEFLHLWCCPARMTRDACVRAVLAVKAVSMSVARLTGQQLPVPRSINSTTDRRNMNHLTIYMYR